MENKKQKNTPDSFKKLIKSIDDITEKNKTKNSISVDDKEKQK